MTDGVSEATDAATGLDDGDDLEALNAAITRSLEQEARGEVTPMSAILARLRARRRAASTARAAELDAGESQGYDRAMSEAQAAKQPRTASDDAEREAFIAAVEDGLADLKAGRTYTHAEVQAEMRRRFPPPTK